MDARTILDPKRRGFWVPDRIRNFIKSINQYFRRILRLYGETRTCSWLAKIAQVVLFDCVWLVLWYQIWESLWGHILICCQTLETWLAPGRDYNYSRWRWWFEYSHVHPIWMFRTCRGIGALYCRQWSSQYLHTDQCTSHDVKSMCWQPQDDKLSSLTAARTGAAHAARHREFPRTRYEESKGMRGIDRKLMKGYAQGTWRRRATCITAQDGWCSIGSHKSGGLG